MGFVIIILFLVYVLISLLIVIAVDRYGKKTSKKWVNGWTAAVILALIPVWDIPVARTYFAYLCNTQAGIKIYRKVELGEEYFLHPGERNPEYSKLSKFAYASGGELNMERLKKDFIIKSSINKKYSWWGGILKHETAIFEMSSNELLSRAKSFGYRGGWLAGLVPTPGLSQECPPSAIPTEKRPYSLHSLLPIKTFSIKD